MWCCVKQDAPVGRSGAANLHEGNTVDSACGPMTGRALYERQGKKCDLLFYDVAESRQSGVDRALQSQLGYGQCWSMGTQQPRRCALQRRAKVLREALRCGDACGIGDF